MSNGTDSFVYNYNQFNNLLEVKKNGQIETTFQYDVNGNQIKEVSRKDINGTIRDITTDYVYDRADRLTNISISDGLLTKKISNYYNGDGQRTRQDDDGYITKYFYDDGSLLFTADANNSKATENILDPYGVIVASKRFDGNYANMYFFYNYDARGSVTSIVNPEGTLVKGYEYDEFGQTKETWDSQFKNDVKFTGAVHDQSANLYYMNSRFYNPSTGRFLTQDSYSGSPYVPWTQHLYSYTGNNPVNYVDPTGHVPRVAFGDMRDSGQDEWERTADDVQQGHRETIERRRKVVNNEKAYTNKMYAKEEMNDDTEFDAKESVKTGFLASALDSVGGYVAGKLFKDKAVYRASGMYGIGTYTSSLSRIASGFSRFLGVAATVGMSVWNIGKDIVNGEYVGACIDAVATAAGFVAGAAIAFVGAAVVSTFAVPAMVVGVVGFALSIGVGVVIDAVATTAKDEYYGR